MIKHASGGLAAGFATPTSALRSFVMPPRF